MFNRHDSHPTSYFPAPTQTLIYTRQQATSYSPSHEIYQQPVVHNGSLVYPSHFTRVEDLRLSVTTHYQAYSKLVLCGLSDEQYYFAFADIIPQWNLKDISLQHLSLDTVRKILSSIRLENLTQVKMADLDEYCLSEIYDKFHWFCSNTPTVIKFQCEPNSVNERWQVLFKYLSGSKPNVFYDKQMNGLSTALTAKDVELEDSLRRNSDLKGLLERQRQVFEDSRVREAKRHDDLQKASAQELKRNQDNLLSQIHVNKRLMQEAKEFKTANENVANQLDRASSQAIGLSSENKALQEELYMAKGTVVTQRELRRRDKKALSKFEDNAAIIAEACHIARIKQIISSAKKCIHSDEESSSSENNSTSSSSDSDSDSVSNSSKSESSNPSDSEHSISSQTIKISSTQSSPKFFINIRRKPKPLIVTYCGIGRKPKER